MAFQGIILEMRNRLRHIMPFQGIILEMRNRLRHPSVYAKSACVVWLACCLLIYVSSQLMRVSELDGKPFIFYEPAEDPAIKVPLSVISSDMPNLPLAYARSPYRNDLYENKKCGHYPGLWDLKFNNYYWQVLHGNQASFYLYSAFYDNRDLTPSSPSLRILGMINRFDTSKFKVYCQLWFEGLIEPVVTRVKEFSYIWEPSFGNTDDGILQPYLMRCHIPKSFSYLIPVSVSLTERPCHKAFNNIRVTYNLPMDGQKKNFAICVKGMDFMYSDHSVRLVEWLELVSLLGADKVYMYVLGTHPNYTKVLDYYQAKGFVHVTKTVLPGNQPGAPSLIHLYHQANVLNQYQNELIPINDCFYRNIYRYKLIVLLDTDEVIVPKTSYSWITLLNQWAPYALSGEKSDVASYYFRNIYFLDDMQEKKGWAEDIPHYMHLLQHVHRAPEYTAPMDFVKSFHNPDIVETLHNHLPFACLSDDGSCKLFPFNPADAHLQHYRKDCPSEVAESCSFYRENAVLDTALWKHKSALIANTTNALKQIGYFKNIKRPK